MLREAIAEELRPLLDIARDKRWRRYEGEFVGLDGWRVE